MRPLTRFSQRQGSVFVLCMWVIILLASMAVSLGVNVRQKAIAYQHLQARETFRNQTESVIKKIIYDFITEFANWPVISRKEWYHNALASGSVNFGSTEIRYELKDENDKVNINTATPETLARLFNTVANLGEEPALRLGYVIADFRDQDDFVQQVFDGGSEKEAYLKAGLDYGPKNGTLECLSELLKVKGMTSKIFESVEKYLSVYGEQGVNINTADRNALYTIDFPTSLVEKIVAARNGPDGREGTADDFTFFDANKITGDLIELYGVSPQEEVRISTAVSHHFLTVNSEFYRLTATARGAGGVQTHIDCIFGIRSGIRYWVEK